MTKTSLFAVSLIAAVPGLLMACLCVMAFLSYAGGGTILLKATTALLLVTGLSFPVLSVVILLQSRSEQQPKRPEAKKEPAAAEHPANRVDRPGEASSDDLEVGVDIPGGDVFESGEIQIDEFEDDFTMDEGPDKKKKR